MVAMRSIAYHGEAWQHVTQCVQHRQYAIDTLRCTTWVTLAAVTTKVNWAHYQNPSQQGVHVAMICDRTMGTSAVFQPLNLSVASDAAEREGRHTVPAALYQVAGPTIAGCSATMLAPLCSAVLPAVKRTPSKSSVTQPIICTAAARCCQKVDRI